jgi:hypothetical protein
LTRQQGVYEVALKQVCVRRDTQEDGTALWRKTSVKRHERVRQLTASESKGADLSIDDSP